MSTPPPPVCSYCPAAAGYVASCCEASVNVCKRHVGAAAAIWLYDLGLSTVKIRRLVAQAQAQREAWQQLVREG